MTRAQLVRRNRAQRAEASRRLSVVPAQRPTLLRRLACAVGLHRMRPDGWTEDFSSWRYRCLDCPRTEVRS